MKCKCGADSTAMSLPVITPEIYEDFRGAMCLITFDGNSRPKWSQKAVDFVAMLNKCEQE